MVEWVLERLAPQVGEILINANQNLEEYGKLGHRVVPDEIGGYAGPLAGLHAGLKIASHALVMTVPCDSPFLPPDLVSRLGGQLRDHQVAVARTGDLIDPEITRLKSCLTWILDAVLSFGNKKIDARHRTLS